MVLMFRGYWGLWRRGITNREQGVGEQDMDNQMDDAVAAEDFYSFDERPRNLARSMRLKLNG